MREGYAIDMVIYTTKVLDENKKGQSPDIDYDLVIEENLVINPLVPHKDAITALVVIRDALQHYHGVTTDPEYKAIVLEAMSGFDEALKQLVIPNLKEM